MVDVIRVEDRGQLCPGEIQHDREQQGRLRRGDDTGVTGDTGLLEFFGILGRSAFPVEHPHHPVAGLDPLVADGGGGPAG